MDPQVYARLVNTLHNLAEHVSDDELSRAMRLRHANDVTPEPPDRPSFVEWLKDPCERARSSHERQRYERRLEHQRELEEIAYEAETEAARIAKETQIRKKQQQGDAYVASEGRISRVTGALHEAQHLEEILEEVAKLNVDPVLGQIIAQKIYNTFAEGNM